MYLGRPFRDTHGIPGGDYMAALVCMTVCDGDILLLHMQHLME